MSKPEAQTTTAHEPVDEDLPEGWSATPLGNVVASTKGNKPPVLLEEKTDGTIPYIDIMAFERGEIRRYAAPGVSKVAEKGTLLIVWDGARSGLVGIMPETGAIGSTLAALAPQGVMRDYLKGFLESQFDFINTNTRGTGIPHVAPGILWSLSFPVAPLAEQKRIVAKVEELLARVNATRERLAKVPQIMKRFRQSVLAAACSGRLTEGWRELNPHVESASQLKSRIKEKRLLAARTRKERKNIEMVRCSSEAGGLPFEDSLPESWAICAVGDIGAVCNGSTPSRKKPEYWDGNIPWVSSGEVQNKVITETRERITEQGLEHSSVRLLPSGTVLMAMIGEGKTRGQSAILRLEATINQNIAAVLLDHGLMSSEYLWYWFRYRYSVTREAGGGSGPRALNCQRVRELPLVLPPLEEQREIVRRVEALFKLADTVEARAKAATARAEKLTQSILAKAFRGELVPTEAELARREGRSYEPASVLLERIQREHVAAGCAPRFYSAPHTGVRNRV